MIHSKIGLGGLQHPPHPTPTPQLQSLHDKVMLTWEPTPKLNSYIIPCHLIQVTKFTRTAKPDFETRFYWLWFYGLFHSRSAFEFHHVFINALCSLSFNGTSKNFEFRWSITGFILKALPVLPAFLLSAKCRFWRITPKRFQVIVF